MKKIEELDKLFNLSAEEKIKEPLLPTVFTKKEDDIEDDYQLARR